MIPQSDVSSTRHDDPAEEKPLQRVLAGLSYTSYSRGYLARCPAHGDRHPSLMVWEDPADEHVGLKCLTGCSRKAIVEAMGLGESDLYVSTRPRALRPLQPGISLIDLAVDKLIHPNLLTRLGVTDITLRGHPAVRIPYYQADGSEYARVRLRTALTAKEGSEWTSGKAPLIPYGLQRLAEARGAGYLVIVEGESDCWTLWQFGLPALGLPGAVLYQTLEREMLAGIERVYVVQEPDKAGMALPLNVCKRLRYVGYQGQVYALNLMHATKAKDPNELLKCDCKGFKTAFEAALRQAELLAAPASSGPQRPETFTLASLMQKELPPVRWAIPGILPEGLTLLCGKPKMGKSWLVLGFALGIACGGAVLGKVQVESGHVLYLALEDNERRLQRRTKQVLQEMHVTPDVLYLAVSWPRLDSGGLEYLELWLCEHPDTRLVIVDTWTKLAPRVQGQKRTQYEEDYDALTPLKELADKWSLAILAVTHLRKLAAEDVLDEISGTTGLTGAVDGFLVLKRERGQQVATLHVIGRDIEEEQALALTFDHATATWQLQGKADDVKMRQRSKERQAILDLLQEHPQGLTAQQVADHSKKNFYTIRNLLKRLVDEQAIIGKRGVFTCLPQQDGGTDSPLVETLGNNDDSRGSRGSSGLEEAMNEPVEGDERLNHGNFAHTADRGYRGSFGSDDESKKNHGNHANHAGADLRGSPPNPPGAYVETTENHGNHANHANHTSPLRSVKSPQEDQREWEEFVL